MELKVDLPALRGQDIDPNTFQRVWDRVMPGPPPPPAHPHPGPPRPPPPPRPAPRPLP